MMTSRARIEPICRPKRAKGTLCEENKSRSWHLKHVRDLMDGQ